MKKLTLLLLAIILTACSFGASEFDQNTAKWDNANVTHYRYNLDISCFCAFRSEMPLTIEVKDGEVVSMTRMDGSTVKAGEPLYDAAIAYSTMERVFDSLKADLNGGAEKVTVTYDPTYGYPNKIDIDNIIQAVDDELYIQISNFEVLK